MMSNLQHFFYMSGYALHVWSAYLLMFILFIVQWYLPSRKLKKINKKRRADDESSP